MKISKRMQFKNKPSKIIICMLIPVVLSFFLLLALVSSLLINGKGVGYILMASVCIAISVVCLFFYWKGAYLPYSRIERSLNAFSEGKENEAYWENEIMEAFNDIMVKKIKDSVDREYTALISKKQAEINALQSQINPHFLYNTLDSIRGQALFDGNRKIAQMTEALATFFRYSISWKGNIVTLADELKNVTNYITIQQFRFNNRFNIIKKISDEEFIMNCRIPKLTIQPIIENAIYHGLETKEGKGEIVIRIMATDARLLINIVDNGIGIPDDLLDSLNESLSKELQLTEKHQPLKHGIALKNVNERIKLCFGEWYGITISSTVGVGTDVAITLPLITDDSYNPQFIPDDAF